MARIDGFLSACTFLVCFFISNPFNLRCPRKDAVAGNLFRKADAKVTLTLIRAKLLAKNLQIIIPTTTFTPYLLLRMARFRRISAFMLADDEPWAPVMYAFFFAFVFTFFPDC